MHTTQALAARFAVSRQTISNWAKVFERHLSPTANPPANAHRRFTDDDLAVLGLVAELANLGMDFESIHASLDAGSRVTLTTTPASNPILQLQALLRQVEQQRDDLDRQLADLRVSSTRDVAERDGMIRLLKEQLAEAQAINRALSEEIGKLKANI